MIWMMMSGSILRTFEGDLRLSAPLLIRKGNLLLFFRILLFSSCKYVEKNKSERELSGEALDTQPSVNLQEGCHHTFTVACYSIVPCIFFFCPIVPNGTHRLYPVVSVVSYWY